MKAEATKMAKMTLIQYHHMGASTAGTPARGVAYFVGPFSKKLLSLSMR
jgi:hypothetical protein